MASPPSESTMLTRGDPDQSGAVDASESASTATADDSPELGRATRPARRGVAGWIINDLANTLFSQNMISNYFPVWVVVVMGGSDGHISLVNTVTMALMLGIGPWLGAVSDRMPRRLPILIATTTGCCLLTLTI